MKILALETSAKAVSAAVSENGRILASGYQDTGLTHSRTLMPIVEHILKNTDLKLSDMDAIAENIAPLVGDAEGCRPRLLYRHPHRRFRRQGPCLFCGQARRGRVHAGRYGPERGLFRRADRLRHGRPPQSGL